MKYVLILLAVAVLALSGCGGGTGNDPASKQDDSECYSPPDFETGDSNVPDFDPPSYC